MKEIERNTEINNQDFYNAVSSFYDEMIGFDESLKRRKELFKKIIPEGVKTIADLGCGSGLDSIGLAQLGYVVSGFDPSPGIIEQASRKSEQLNLNIKFIQSAVHVIDESFHHQFDLVISLGNTFTNIPRENFSTSIQKSKMLLKDEGTFIIQVLNYKSFLTKKERIVNITKKNEFIFVRFYDFYDDYMNFNILKFSLTNLVEREIHTTKLYPYLPEEFENELRNAGFRDIKFLGSLKGESFNKLKSSDLIIKAVL